MAHSGSDVEEALRLDRAAIEAVDASDLLTDILAIPEHMRDAAVAGGVGAAGGVGLARRPRRRRHGRLGDRRRARQGGARRPASRPIFTARAYGLPAWTQPDTTVLCA